MIRLPYALALLFPVLLALAPTPQAQERTPRTAPHGTGRSDADGSHRQHEAERARREAGLAEHEAYLRAHEDRHQARRAARDARYRFDPVTGEAALAPEAARAFFERHRAARDAASVEAAAPGTHRERAPDGYAPPAPATAGTRGGPTFTVNSAYDNEDEDPGNGSCFTGLFLFVNGLFHPECTLRAAIEEANATAGTDAVLIQFAVIGGPSGSQIATGVWRIQPNLASSGALGALPTITRTNTTVNALTQSGALCGDLASSSGSAPRHTLRIVLDGSLQTTTSAGIAGSTLTANVDVRGLVVQNFPGYGISVGGNGSLVECSYVGTNYLGELAQPNAGGILVSGILALSGAVEVQNNLVSGNDGLGVFVSRSLAVVEDNLVGTDDDGNQPLGNDETGVLVSGDDVQLDGNVVSANGAGALGGNGVELGLSPGLVGDLIAQRAVLTNNRVGLSRFSTDLGLGNEDDGVAVVDGATDHDLGLAGAGNVVSANGGYGVYMTRPGPDPFAGLNVLRANVIGLTSSTGTAAPNFLGVYSSSSSNVVGGLGAGEGNVISGNTNSGLFITADAVDVLGNTIGLNASGTTRPNGGDGVETPLFNPGGAGSTISGNTISGNTGAGIYLGADASDVTIGDNRIGTTADGLAARGNGFVGLFVGGLEDVLVEDNVISANTSDGVRLSTIRVDTFAPTLLRDNTIGLAADGTTDLGNGGYGVYVLSRALPVYVGEPGAGNVISGNGDHGVFVEANTLPPAGAPHRIQGNTIGLNAAGTAARPNGGDGVAIQDENVLVGGATAGAGNVVSGNAGVGIRVEAYTSGSTYVIDGTVVEGNTVGLNASGTAAVANGLSGLALLETAGTTVLDNVLSGNADAGLYLEGTTGDVVERNLIGTDRTQALALGNGLNGVYCFSATDSRIGENGVGNVVANNTGDGLFLRTPCEDVAIVGNVVYGNTQLGIDLAPNGVTPNDPDDLDAGANDLTNFPVITSATNDGANATLVFTFDGLPNTRYRVLACRNDTPDPSGFGECEDPNHSFEAVTNASGVATVTRTIPASRYPVGDWVTATATVVDLGEPTGFGPTSEFSAAVQVQAAGGLTVTITPTNPVPPVVLTRGQRVFFDITFEVAAGGPSSFEYWTEAVLPNNSVRGPLIGPNTLNVSPPQTVTLSFSQRVPNNAPLGDYVYRVEPGTFPGTVLDSDSFDATVVASEAVAAREAGEPDDAWLAYDHEGNPMAPGTVHDFRSTPAAATHAPAASGASQALPEAVALGRPYPNPTARAATLPFALPAAGPVRLVVYDVLGREVAVLVDGVVEAGRHEVVLDARALPSGLYFVRLEAGDTPVRPQALTLTR
jgi:CSLREA domain-containing protein